jgi:hypothetical protein
MKFNAEGFIITDLLRDKPELAPALVTQAIPVSMLQ